MSTYFDESSNRVTEGALVRSTHINTVRDDAGVAFDMLPEPEEIKENRTTFGVDSGTANAYDIALDYPPTSWTTGQEIVFIPLYSNTGASTLTFGIGAKTIKGLSGGDLEANDIIAGDMVALRYDGTYLRFCGSNPASAIAGAPAAAAAAAVSAAAAASSAGDAQTAQSAAETAQSNAETAETNAETAETNAETAETNAGISAAAAAASAALILPNYTLIDHTDSPYTATAGEQLFADITAGNLIINFPASPSNDDYIKVVKIGAVSSGYTLTMGRNTKNIMDVAEDLVIDIDDVPLMFVYLLSTTDWRIAA